jgi:hypothetical protein
VKIKQNHLLIISLLAIIIFISGCMATTIKDVKTQDYVGKKVTVSGTVQNTIKIGTLSGYTIKDATDTIGVSSESLPKEGNEIRVTGILMKDTLLGYYIKVD